MQIETVERRKLTVGSLFAGIGGFEEGLEGIGFETKWQVEIDDRKRSVLAARWPGARQFSDVRAVSSNELERVDVVTAGFPCQDISPAGRRAGINGHKSGLWTEVVRVVGCVRPRYIIVENSPGLLKRGMGVVLGDLAGLGFDAEWTVLPAAFRGAAHLRARLWILAYPCGLRNEADDTLCPGWPKPDVHPRWASEPEMGRVADGFPGWMVGALGDAVCPPIVEWIGRRILEAEAATVTVDGAQHP